ncbi:MAG: alpha/beta hydrolase [Oscillospiraceae bacterium]|nr:alpha/beta hydrolase [Oscillospiraceae bacterium]
MKQEMMLSYGTLQIPCVLTTPESGLVERIVLGVHGLGGSTTDDIQSSLAEEMAYFDSAMLRFDFPAHGESPADSSELNLDNCINSLLTVARKGRELYPEVEDLCIFATGFGAYITLLALDELWEMPGTVKLVVQTPSFLMHKSILSMKNISRPTLQAMGKVTFRAARPFDITYPFFQEMEEHIALAAYPIPILILHTDKDIYIPMEDVKNFRRLNERSKLVIIHGAGHRFLEEGAWDMVLDLTRDWFNYEQVLLEDWI